MNSEYFSTYDDFMKGIKKKSCSLNKIHQSEKQTFRYYVIQQKITFRYSEIQYSKLYIFPFEQLQKLGKHNKYCTNFY